MPGGSSRIDVARHLVELYEPPNVARSAFAIIFLHGVGQETLADAPAFTKVLDELGLVGISPHGGLSWWSDRICPEFDAEISAEKWLLEKVLPVVEQRYNLTPPKFGLLGISMGGQGALRLAFKHPKLFPAMAGISSAIEYYLLYDQGYCINQMYDSREQCRQDTAPMHIHPSEHPPHIFFCIDPADQPWQRGNDRLHEKLAALGIEHECDLITQAGGHSWDYFNAMAEPSIRFIHQGLLVQSRRLL